MLVVNNYTVVTVLKMEMVHRNHDGEWDPFLSLKHMPIRYSGFSGES